MGNPSSSGPPSGQFFPQHSQSDGHTLHASSLMRQIQSLNRDLEELRVFHEVHKPRMSTEQLNFLHRLSPHLGIRKRSTHDGKLRNKNDLERDLQKAESIIQLLLPREELMELGPHILPTGARL